MAPCGTRSCGRRRKHTYFRYNVLFQLLIKAIEGVSESFISSCL